MGSSTNWHDQLSGATAVLFPSTTALAVTIKAIMAPDGKKIIIVIIRTCVLGPRGLHCPVGKLRGARWKSARRMDFGTISRNSFHFRPFFLFPRLAIHYIVILSRTQRWIIRLFRVPVFITFPRVQFSPDPSYVSPIYSTSCVLLQTLSTRAPSSLSSSLEFPALASAPDLPHSSPCPIKHLPVLLRLLPFQLIE